MNAWAVIDPNWGEPRIVLETIRATKEEAIEASLKLQELNIYSGAQFHCIPQIPGKWENLEHFKYTVQDINVYI